MEIIHEVALSQYAAKSLGGALKLGTRDSYGAEKIHVTRDETWAGLTVTATFRIGGTAVRTPLDGRDMLEVPQKATSEAGRGTIVFVGTDGEQQIITKNLNYSVDDHDDAGGDAPNPTPDVWAQFVAQTKDNAERAELSAEIAGAAAAAAGQNADSAQQDAAAARQQAQTATVMSQHAQQAAVSAQAARAAAEGAATSAADDAQAAAASEDAAEASAAAALQSQNLAQGFAAGAQDSATAAGGSATDAASSADAAAQAAENAAQSEGNAADSAEAASSSAAAAADSKESAAISEERAAGSAKISESWAVGGTGIRAGEDTNNAKYWAQLAQTVAQGAQGYFVTAAALRAAHPAGQDGWWAIVGETDTIWIWDSDSGAWVDSSTTIDMSNYYSKTESDGRYATATQGQKADTAVQPAALDGYAKTSDLPTKPSDIGAATAAQGSKADSAMQRGDDAALYSAMLAVDGWTGSADTGYSQVAALAPASANAPVVTQSSVLYSTVACDQTSVPSTNAKLQKILGIINLGDVVLGNNEVLVSVAEKPDADIVAYWKIRRW